VDDEGGMLLHSLGALVLSLLLFADQACDPCDPQGDQQPTDTHVEPSIYTQNPWSAKGVYQFGPDAAPPLRV